MRTRSFMTIVLAIGMVLTVTGVARADLQDGLISYWSFDETSGTTVADGFGVNDGTASGAYDLNVSGKIGSGIDFSGGQVLVGSVGISGNADRTIAGWFHSDLTDPPGDWRGIYGFYKTTGGNGEFFGVDVINNDDVGIHIYGFEEPLADLEISSWHYVVATYDSSANRIYTSYDGAAMVERTPSQTVNTSDLFMMGFRPDQNNDFDGQVDEVGVWNRALNGAEVTELWNGGAGKHFLNDGALNSKVAAGNWSDATTWEGTGGAGGIPTNQTTVIVDDTAAVADVVTVVGSGLAGSLDITGASSVVVAGSADLTVRGATTGAAGSLDLPADSIFTGGRFNSSILTITPGDTVNVNATGRLTVDSTLDVTGGTILGTGGATVDVVAGGALTANALDAATAMELNGGALAIGDDIAVANLTINSGSTLTVAATKTLSIDSSVLKMTGASTIGGEISGAGGGVYDLVIGDDGHTSVDGTVDGTTLPNVNNITINRGAYFFGTADGTNSNLGSIDTIAGRIRFDGDERCENALIGSGVLRIDIDDVNAGTIAWDGDNEGGGGFAARDGALDVELNPSIGGPATIYMGYHENDGANPGIENERELNFGAEDADSIVTLLNPLNGVNGNREFNVYGNPALTTDGVKLRVAQLVNFGQITVRGDGEGKMILDVEAAAAQLTNNNNLVLQGVGELHIVSTGGPGSLQMGSDTGYDWILVESMESNRNVPGHAGDKLVLDGTVNLSGTKVRVGWRNEFNATLVSTGASETMQELQIHNDDSGGVSTATFAGDLNVTDLTYTRDESVLTVSGNLTASRFETRENSTVNITGDVTSGHFDTDNNSAVTVGGNVLVNDRFDVDHDSQVTIGGNLTSTTGRVWVAGGGSKLEVFGDITTGNPDGDQVEFVGNGQLWVHGNINAGRVYSAWSDPGNTPSLRMVGGGTITTWRDNQDNYYQGNGHPIIGDLSYSNDDAITSYVANEHVQLRRGTMNIGSPTRYGAITLNRGDGQLNVGQTSGPAHLNVWGEPGTTVVSSGRLFVEGQDDANRSTADIIGNVDLRQQFEVRRYSDVVVTGNVTAERFYFENDGSNALIIGDATSTRNNPGFEFRNGGTLAVTGTITEAHRFELGLNSGGKLIANNVVMTNTGEDFEWEKGVLAPGVSLAGDEIAGVLTITGASNTRKVNLWNQAVYEWNLGGAEGAASDRIDLVNLKLRLNNWVLRPGDVDPDAYINSGTEVTLLTYDTDGEDKNMPAIDLSLINADHDAALRWDTSGVTVSHDAGGKRVYLTGLVVEPENFFDVYTWDGDAGNLWATPANWELLGGDPPTAPTYLDKAVVNTGGIAQADSDQTVHSLDINGGAVTVNPGSTLSVTNDLNLIDGSLTIPDGATIDKVNRLTMTGGVLDVTGQIDAVVVSLNGQVALNDGAVFNATTIGIDGGTTTVADGAVVNGDFSLNAGGRLAITGNVELGNLAYNGGTFALGGNTLTVGTYRQNGGTAALVGGDALLADTYQLNGGNVGFAMTDATGASNVQALGNATTLDTGFAHTYTGKTIVDSGATLTLADAGVTIDATDYLIVSGTMNVNGDVTTTHGAGPVSEIAPGALSQSIFEGTPDNGVPMNMEGAAYTHASGRTMTGVKAGTILTLTDTHSGLATGEIQNWNTFPTYGGGDHMVTAFSGVFIPSENGSYNFRGDSDDWSQMWIDMDDNGVFDAGENVGPYAWHSSGNKDLVAGTAYDIIIMSQEHAGGQSVNWFVTKPSGGEDRVNPADPAGNGGAWGALQEWTGTTKVTSGGVLNIGNGAVLDTANVAIDSGGAINVNDGLITTAHVDINGVLRLGDGEAVSDAGLGREVPLTASAGGMIDISTAGGLNRSSRMLIETYGILKGDLTNLAYSDTPGSGLVTFENRAVLAPTSAAGTFPLDGDLGGSKLLYGVLNSGDSVQAGANVEAVGGSTIFAGAYFGAGSYAGGDYSATLTGETGSGDLLVVVNDRELKLNGATLASDSGTTRFEVLTGGRVTVTGGGFNGGSDIVVTGMYDPADGSGMNTTGQAVFRVQGNDVLKDGQNIRVDKGVFNTHEEWPVAPGATATVTIGSLGAMAPMDWGNHDWASDHVRRGTYIFEAGSVLMTDGNTNRLRQSEARWDISPDAFIALRDNIWTQDIDPAGPGGQYELDNVNWMLGMADQVREIRMGDGRRLTKAWDHNDRMHDNNASIIPSASSPPSSVIFSAPSAGGSLNIDAVVLLGGVDININDQIGTATYYLDHIKNENDLTRTRLAQTGRVEMDGRTIQADNITVRNGFLRLFSNDRDVTPTITGDIVVWDDGELEMYFARGEGNDNGPATNAAMVRHQVENDALLPAGKGLYLDQGSMYRPYYRNFDSSSPVGGDQDEWRQGHTTATPHVVNQTITVRGSGAVAGGRLSSGDPMTIIRFDEEGGDGNNDNHILFPNIVLEEGAHLGIQRGDVDREELRLGVRLKGNARMERENDEWSFQDVNVETPGDEFTLTVDRDGNGGQYDMYGIVGAGVTLMGVDVHFDFNWGANMEDGAVVANLGNQTPGEPNSDGYLRVFTGSDGNNPITGGTLLLGGNQDLEIIVDDHADTQIVNNMGATIRIADDGTGTRDGYIRLRRRQEDLAVSGKVVIGGIALEGAATGHIDHNDGTDYNMLRVDTGTGGGSFNANWGGHDFNLNELTGAGRLYNGIFHVDATLAPGAGSAGTLTVQNLVVEGAANYEMQFDVADADKVHVEDILTVNDGWTLELLSNGGFADPGEEYDVFTWNGSATVSLDGSVLLASSYTLVNTAGWDITSAVLNYDAGGKRIYLTGVDGLDDLSWNVNDGNWNDGANWSTGNPPAANSVPLVDRIGRIATVANGGQIAFRLTVEGGRVDIDGGDLSIATDVNVNGAAAELSVTDGALNVAGNLNVGGAGGAVTVTADVGLARQGVANASNSVNVLGNGNLTVSDGGELNTPALNTAGMTNLIAATGAIGTVNITNGTTTIVSTAIPQVSATGGVLNAEGDGVENLTVGGTAKVKTTAATTAGDLQMSGGRMLLTGGGLTVTTANLAGGVMDASDNALTVNNSAQLGDLTLAATGGVPFLLSGADVANDSVARTLTLQGGVITAASGAMPTGLKFWLDASDATTLYQDAGGTTPAADGMPVGLWKDKSGNGYDVSQGDAGLQAGYDVSTNPLNGQATVYFENDVLGRANDIGITGNADRTVITVWHNATGTGQNYQHTFHHGNGGVTGESYGHSVSRGGNAGEIGNHYWGEGFNSTATTGLIQANIAISTWDGDGAGADGLDSWYVNGAAAGTYTRAALNTGANDLLLGSRLNPQTEGIQGNIAEVLVFDRILTADEINNIGGHLGSKWGIPAPAWTGGLRFNPAILSTTSVVATENSTLAVASEPGDPLTLAGIEIAGGKTLTVDSPAIAIQLTNMTLGSGSMLKSPLTAEITGSDSVAITVSGRLSAGGGNSALGYAGDEFGLGADWYTTSLTLSGGVDSVFDWTFSSAAETDVDGAATMVAVGDRVNVFGTVNMGDGLTIQLVDGLAPGAAVSGVDVALFWAIEDAVFNPANITIRSPVGAAVEWTWDSLEYVNEEYVVLKNLVTGVQDGDANGDGVVNYADVIAFNAQLGQRGPGLTCDWIADEIIDMLDFQVLKDNMGFGAGGGAPELPASETPEPATMSLLAIGGLLVLRRRRQGSC